MRRTKKKANSEYYNFKSNELNDSAIIRDMGKAKEMYEKGEILEAAFLMRELADAIESLDPDRF